MAGRGSCQAQIFQGSAGASPYRGIPVADEAADGLNDGGGNVFDGRGHALAGLRLRDAGDHLGEGLVAASCRTAPNRDALCCRAVPG